MTTCTHTAEAEVHGHHVEGEAWVRPDLQRRRLEWGAEGPDGYHGELQVDELEQAVAVLAQTAAADDRSSG